MVRAAASEEGHMARKRKKSRAVVPKLLTSLPSIEEATGNINVVVETPKGSLYKYKYDAGDGAFRLLNALPEGLSFPYDFGFIPSTRGEDGDPLDALLLLDHPVAAGCVATARLAGVFEIRQRERTTNGSAKWRRNDRFIAVASLGHAYQHVNGLDNLSSEMLDEIEGFFILYARSTGRELEVLKRSDRRRAEKLIKAGRT
jgi:inorganic pyrophosphatase